MIQVRSRCGSAQWAIRECDSYGNDPFPTPRIITWDSPDGDDPGTLRATGASRQPAFGSMRSHLGAPGREVGGSEHDRRDPGPNLVSRRHGSAVATTRRLRSGRSRGHADAATVGGPRSPLMRAMMPVKTERGSAAPAIWKSEPAFPR